MRANDIVFKRIWKLPTFYDYQIDFQHLCILVKVLNIHNRNEINL